MNLRRASIGDVGVRKIYLGEHLVFPKEYSDHLELWLDFGGRRNSDDAREVAEDLSGNGRNGKLKEFPFDSQSGYNDGLQFDGESGYLEFPNKGLLVGDFTLHVYFSIDVKNEVRRKIIGGDFGEGYGLYVTRDKVTYVVDGDAEEETHHSIETLDELPEGALVGISVVKKGDTVHIYLNGEEKEVIVTKKKPLLPPQEGSEGNSMYVCLSDSFPRFSGKIYSIKILDREVTKEDISNGYTQEDIRWQ